MPKLKRKLTWKTHKARWKECELCDLCERRSSVVLLKGKIPCDVLFVGEAPGQSEDTLGKPFVGPAGHLLERMIENANPGEARVAFTNVISCIPLGSDGRKVKEPPKDSVTACSDRLDEVLRLCKPDWLVGVGKLSDSVIEERYSEKGYGIESIIHPAAILRADVSQKGLAIQRTEIILRDLFDSI